MKITWGGSPVKSTEYRYNARSQRSERIEKSGTTETARYYYLYEGKDLLCRYVEGVDENNDPALVIDRQYLSQGEQRKNGTAWSSYYYNRDHLGSIREVLKYDGDTNPLVARYDYDPYGKRLPQYEASGYACDLGFTGHITQQSGVSGQGEIVLTLFRAYDPLLGRWLSADPIGEEGGLNLYGYALNDPINKWDPLGLDVFFNQECEAGGHAWVKIGGKTPTGPSTYGGYPGGEDEEWFGEPMTVFHPDPHEDDDNFNYIQYETTPAQEAALEKWINDHYDVNKVKGNKNRDYNVGTNDCRNFSSEVQTELRRMLGIARKVAPGVRLPTRGKVPPTK